MIARGNVATVHTGKAARIAGRGDGLWTAYVKTPVTGPVRLNGIGLAGDEQADRRVHGGPEKAVYGYPLSGYDGWRAEFPGLTERFVPGAMGENLVVAGLDEASVHIGDIVRAGTALLQVAQIREPCATFTAMLGTARAARAMTRSGRCGWYYRVLEDGSVSAGDGHDIVERPNPGWPVARLAAFAAGRSGTVEAIAELATLPGLTRAWQIKAAQALERQHAGS